MCNLCAIIYSLGVGSIGDNVACFIDIKPRRHNVQPYKYYKYREEKKIYIESFFFFLLLLLLFYRKKGGRIK